MKGMRSFFCSAYDPVLVFADTANATLVTWNNPPTRAISGANSVSISVTPTTNIMETQLLTAASRSRPARNTQHCHISAPTPPSKRVHLKQLHWPACEAMRCISLRNLAANLDEVIVVQELIRVEVSYK